MKTSYGIQRYVVRQRESGLLYEKGEYSLSAFCRYVGDVQLAEVQTGQVLSYLDQSVVRATTWIAKYRMIMRFLIIGLRVVRCRNC